MSARARATCQNRVFRLPCKQKNPLHAHHRFFTSTPDGSGHRRRVLQIITALDRPVHVVTREDKAAHFRDHPLVTLHTVTQAEIEDLYRVLRLDEVESQSESLEDTAQYALLARLSPDILHIDVCTEVAEVARVLEIPYTFTLMHGDRMKDSAHEATYAGAKRLLAPYPEALRDATLPALVHAKTVYCGLMSGRESVEPVAKDPHTVACVLGKGFSTGYANALSGAVLATLAEEFRDYKFQVLGDVEARDTGKNLEYLGFVSDPTRVLQRAEIVLGTTGYNVLSEVAQLGARFVTVPAKTPFDEQLVKARLLDRLNYAVCVEEVHDLTQWRQAFERARQLQPIRELFNPHAAEAAAQAIAAQVSE